MPTLNPRVNVTVTPSTYALLKQLSKLTKTSQSGIVADLLESAAPVFSRTVEVLLAAEQAQRGMSAHVRNNLEEAQELVHKQLGLVLEDLGTHTADLVTGLEAIQRRAPKKRAVAREAPQGLRTAPRSNRGGATSQPTENKHKTKPVRRLRHG